MGGMESKEATNNPLITSPTYIEISLKFLIKVNKNYWTSFLLKATAEPLLFFPLTSSNHGPFLSMMTGKDLVWKLVLRVFGWELVKWNISTYTSRIVKRILRYLSWFDVKDYFIFLIDLNLSKRNISFLFLHLKINWPTISKIYQKLQREKWQTGHKWGSKLFLGGCVWLKGKWNIVFFLILILIWIYMKRMSFYFSMHARTMGLLGCSLWGRVHDGTIIFYFLFTFFRIGAA